MVDIMGVFLYIIGIQFIGFTMKAKDIKYNEKWAVAIDLDGTLCNFEKKVSEINNMEFDKIPKRKIWTSISEYDKNVQPFFESLELLPDAMQLFNFVKNNFINYYILSASGRTPKNAAEQKRNWCKKHLGHVVVKIVQSSEQKSQYATPNSILIDDREKSIKPWVDAGGIGILHVNSAQSISKLKEIINLK
jgi:hypothetical protein